MSFKDTFTKEDSKSSLLDYDDGAFYYFAATALIVVLVPWTLTHIKQRLTKAKKRLTAANMDKLPTGEPLRRCKCSLCSKSQAPQTTAAESLWEQFVGGKGELIKGFALAAGWIIFTILCLTSLSFMKSTTVFDPFDILNITQSATDVQIKKAYRTMSLKFHPDRNKNDPSSAAKFIMVSKAFQSLTDEVAKRNYQKYGNPDGPGMMKVGIGLPKWLVSDSNQVFILAIFCMGLLMIVPACFIMYYQRISEYAPNGLKHETMNFLAGFMSERTMPHQVLDFVAASAECRAIPLRVSDNQELAALSKSVELHQDPEKTFRNPKIKKNLLLLACHLQRKTHLLSPALKEDLTLILKKAIPITRGMIDISFMVNWIPTIQAVLAFRKALYQANELKDSPITQLPHTTTARAADIVQFVRRHPVNNFRDLIQTLLKNKKEALSAYSDAEIADVQAVFDQLPDIELTASVYVEDEDEICVGDIATCKVKLTRKHLKDGEAQGPIHAPFYPGRRFEEWFFFISDAQTNTLHGCKSAKSLAKEIEVEAQFLVTAPGARKLIVVAICDSYFGVDHNIHYAFKALNKDQTRRSDYVHPEDAALDNQPSLYQQMIGNFGDDESSEDSGDENELAEQSKNAASQHTTD